MCDFVNSRSAVRIRVSALESITPKYTNRGILSARKGTEDVLRLLGLYPARQTADFRSECKALGVRVKVVAGVVNGSISATVAEADAGDTAGNERAVKYPAWVFQSESCIRGVDDTFDNAPGCIAEINGSGIQSDDGTGIGFVDASEVL